MARKEMPAESSSTDTTSSTSKTAKAKANSTTAPATVPSTASTRTKRKLAALQQDDSKESAEQRSSTDADSPASKFKKLEISQIEGPHSTPLKTSPPPPPPSTTTSPTSPPVVSQPAAASSATATASQSAVEAFTSESRAAKKNKNRQNKKRKQPAGPNADRKSPKKSKTDADAEDAAEVDAGNNDDDDNDNEDDSPHDPTTAELRQADRPENVPQIETTRQKKRDKHAKVQETAKVDSVQREELRNREYLVQWRDDRTAWKYNKLRQIAITKSLFRDEPELDDELWQLAMEYLCGTKGQLRQVLREAAQQVIDTIDARIAAESDDTLVQTVNYGRARTFLQMLE